MSHRQPSTAPSRPRRKPQWPLIGLAGAGVVAAILVSMTFTSHDPTRNALGAPVVPVTQAPTTLVSVPPPLSSSIDAIEVVTQGCAIKECRLEVGKQIAVGSYRTEGPSSKASGDCYYMRLSDTGGRTNYPLKVEVLHSAKTVLIKDVDKTFVTANCLPWRRVG